jgi:hypothetical protein
MKLVQTVVVRGEADVIDANIAFHLNAGVDLMVAAVDDSDHEAAAVLESYAHEGYVRVTREGELAALARQAVEEGADWIVPGEPREFWWPRGESLKEILAAVPKRYTAVQGLIRPFLPTEGGDAFFADRATVRRSTLHDSDVQAATSLKAVTRTDEMAGVPLRAWYPIEIFRIPQRNAEPISEEERERGLEDSSLIVDTRLRDALRALRVQEPVSSRQFAVPSDSATGGFEFPTPDVVDDAAYAVECAAVGEVSLEKLERRIDELEAQLARLERRFWSRVRVRVSRLARSSGSPASHS